MTSTATSVEHMESQGQAAEPWTVRRLFARHRTAAISALVLLVVLVAFTVVGIVSAGPVVVGDSTTCAEWGSANFNQQHAYARLYLREHGAPPGRANDPASVVAAIDNGCSQAYANDAQDTAIIVQAINP